MMAMVSPALQAFCESLSSLKFANRAKNIKNQPIVNEDVDQRALLRKYEVELKRLKNELDERNKHLIDKTRLIQLQQERKRAQQDKKAAMAALEQRSKEFFMEREEKKKLEEKNQDHSLSVVGRWSENRRHASVQKRTRRTAENYSTAVRVKAIGT